MQTYPLHLPLRARRAPRARHVEPVQPARAPRLVLASEPVLDLEIVSSLHDDFADLEDNRYDQLKRLRTARRWASRVFAVLAVAALTALLVHMSLDGAVRHDLARWATFGTMP